MGTIRFDGSVGELNVEGWDRPEVEITLTRYTETDNPTRATGELNSIHVTAKRDGAGVLAISTSLPARNFFARTFDGRTKGNLNYRIRVPRDSRLVVEHDGGDLVVYDVAGDIDAHAPHGSILLLLPKAECPRLMRTAALAISIPIFVGPRAPPRRS